MGNQHAVADAVKQGFQAACDEVSVKCADVRGHLAEELIQRGGILRKGYAFEKFGIFAHTELGEPELVVCHGWHAGVQTVFLLKTYLKFETHCKKHRCISVQTALF